MKHSLQLRLSQHLTLTPQLQQSIKLLQLSTQELDLEIERYLRENPLLEREEPIAESFVPVMMQSDPLQSNGPEATPSPEQEISASSESFDNFGSGDTFSEVSYGSGAGRDEEGEERDYPQTPALAPSLREHLVEQIGLMNFSQRDHALMSMLIETLNDDGYMTQSLEDILELIPEELGVEAEELKIALEHLQHLDPPGVGAQSLSQCLRLQLKAMSQDTPLLDKALDLVNKHLEVLAARDYAKLRRLIKCDEDELRRVQKLIVSLNPKPGRNFSNTEIRYVVPDVSVSKIKGQWVASLNREAMPKLRVNKLYSDILSRSHSSAQHLSSQLQEAKWMVKNVQQRFDTILRVSQAIVERQIQFLEHGAIAMKPLVLREIADVLQLHESTVSRVTTNKYMRTPRGIFELKYFFGSHVGTDGGGEASSTAIRALIKQLVANENSRKPLSDSQISSILGQQGMVVARRTVAKYRESMQILPGNLRKTL
jgi:RNA polymerase sigma-54 factor